VFAGGTATAYHLLAEALLKSPRLQLTFLGATDNVEACNAVASKHSRRNMAFECFKPEHLEADIVETFPLERLSHAVLSWMQVWIVILSQSLQPLPRALSVCRLLSLVL
jgi:hypothetical protein